MRGVMGAVAACATLAASADARTVRSGSTERMTRTAVLDATMVLTHWSPDPDDEGAIELVSWGARPRAGSRFVLVDESGLYGSVVIARVDAKVDPPSTAPTYTATARWIDRPGRELTGDLMAVGPTERSFPRARVVSEISRFDTELEPAPVRVLCSMDVDGDGRFDVAVVEEECSDAVEAIRRQGPYYVDCLRTWSHGEDGWRSIDSWFHVYEDTF